VIPCGHCGQTMARLALEEHVTQDCPLVEVVCPHERFGCPQRTLRRDAEQHLTTCVYEGMKGFLYSQEKVV